MPLYAYRCPECDHAFDERRSVDERDRARCPQCNKKATRLLATVGAVGMSAPEPMGCGEGACAARQAAGMPCSMN